MGKRNIVNDGNKCNEKIKYPISQWDSVGLLRSERFCKSCSCLEIHEKFKIYQNLNFFGPTFFEAFPS